MVKKLTKTGNSGALIFDKTMMELLHVSLGDSLSIAFSNGSMIVTPVNVGFDRDELSSAAGKVFKRNARTFKKLAE